SGSDDEQRRFVGQNDHAQQGGLPAGLATRRRASDDAGYADHEAQNSRTTDPRAGDGGRADHTAPHLDPAETGTHRGSVWQPTADRPVAPERVFVTL